MKKMGLLLPCLLLVLVGCDYRRTTVEGTTATRSPEETRRETQTVRPDGEVSKEKMEKYRKDTQDELARLQGELDKLKARAKESGEEVRARLQPQIEALHKQTEAARQRLVELQERGAAAWNAARPALDRTLQDLRDAFRQASEQFNKK